MSRVVKEKLTLVPVVHCDICKEEKDCNEVNYPVWFMSEQTEGRPCKPYISQQKLDICEECTEKVIKVVGWGAQGRNDYEYRT